MNAPVVAGIARPPRKEDYFPIVRGLRPFVKDEEMQLRASLLLMRDQAMGRKRRACAPAWMILDVIEQTASENAMNERVDIETLRELRRICLNCACAASSFDGLFRAPTSESEGEANGRG